MPISSLRILTPPLSSNTQNTSPRHPPPSRHNTDYTPSRDALRSLATSLPLSSHRSNPLLAFSFPQAPLPHHSTAAMSTTSPHPHLHQYPRYERATHTSACRHSTSSARTPHT